MPGQTKYFISNTNGFFVNWYSDITGVESHGQALKASGNGGDDAVYVGQGTKVDATGLTSTGGSDSIYLTGTFNDYAQTLDGSTYTFKRTVTIGGTDYQEEVSFTASDGDKVYFANGFVKIDITGTDGLLGTNGFKRIASTDVNPSSKTLADPLTSQPAIDKGTASEVGATKVFISDNDGEHIIVGAGDGKLYFYKHTQQSFNLVASNFNPFSHISIGANATPTFADIDQDGDLDLIIGNTAGALT